MKHRLNLILGLLLILVITACEKEENEDEEGNNGSEMSSTYNENESHNAGQNCMACHKSGGNGEGWFTAAGTVYNASASAVYPKATVKLYTGPNATGSLVKTIEVDSKGNFYTTTDINFGSGLYTTVTGTTGNIAKMSAAISTGQCNSCHGSSTGKISVN